MSEGVASIIRRNAYRFAMTGIVGIWLSGCADATRFGEGGNPFSNPFASAAPDPAAPTPRISSSKLPAAKPYNKDYATTARPSPAAVASSHVPAPETTGAIHPHPDPMGGSASGWSAVGGSPVIVGEADDSATLSRRYGVPEAALLSANGLHARSDVKPNMRIVIPVYGVANSSHAAPKVAKADDDERDAPKDKARKAAKADDEERDTAKSRKVAKREKDDDEDGDARKPERAESSKKHKVEAKNDDSDGDEADTPKREKKVAKADKSADKPEKLAKAEKQAETPVEKPAKPEKIAEAPKPEKPVKAAPQVAKAEPPKFNKVEAPTPTASIPAKEESSSQSAENSQFRWPARGRIIQGFKSGGNDGINIALPEGTSVRAAEDGKVAYAGNQLKGYGNLVLIRHSNGFVTAYANNGELNVKSGDSVHRGQVIAKSGATGDVSSPQLHFEVRRGQTPVDPTGYLAGL